MPLDTAIVDGRRLPLAEACLSLTDEGVARGDGAFETVGVWDGFPFQLRAHLERLQRSLAAIGLPPADTHRLDSEARKLLDDVAGDAMLRLYMTGSGTRVLTCTPQPPRLPVRHLVPQLAPWIRPPTEYPAAGAKTMSYMPNMAATRAAQRAGGDDALLVSAEGWVLEGPTFTVLWVRDGQLQTATVDLGIVESISRRVLIALARDAGIDVDEGHYHLSELAGASEVLVCSSVRDVVAVSAVGEDRFPASTPVRDRLSAALVAARRGRPA